MTHFQELVEQQDVQKQFFFILILFIKMTNRGRLLSTKDEVRTSTSSKPGAARIKHQFRLNRGRTDKTSTSSEPGPHGQTISSCEPGPHGKLHYPS